MKQFLKLTLFTCTILIGTSNNIFAQDTPSKKKLSREVNKTESVKTSTSKKRAVFSNNNTKTKKTTAKRKAIAISEHTATTNENTSEVKDKFIKKDSKGRKIFQEDKGNTYYINSNGDKTYLKKK